MNNSFFKAQVDKLLEKSAFGSDPEAVAQYLSPELRAKVLRGVSIEKGLGDLAGAGVKGITSGTSALQRVTSGDPNSLLTKGLGGVSSAVTAHPKAAITTALMAPILMQAFNSSQSRGQDELMGAAHDPLRTITASVDEFLEQKAAAFGGTPDTFGMHIQQGFGKAVGGSLVGLAAQLIGSRLSSAKNIAIDEPRRRGILETLFKSDPVLKDAIARHPDSKSMILEAYATMVRFAPNLSLDINATRSFLRESVLGGSGVNYATIKNLVDTERSIVDAKPKFSYGGK